MLLLEEAINRVVNQEGQQLVPLAAFSLDKLRIQSMFKQALMEFQEFFPNIVTEEFSLVSGGSLELKDAVNAPTSIRFAGYPAVPNLNNRYEKKNWAWDPHKNTISSVIGGGPWLVTYPKRYTLKNLEVAEEVMVVEGEDEIDFDLRGEFKQGSLLITRRSDGLSMKVDNTSSYADGIRSVSVEGKLGEGEIDITNLRGHIELYSTKDDIIDITYISKYLAIEELDLGCHEYLDWFGSKLLTSIGTLKMLSQIDGLPFNIAVDDLRSRGLELQNMIEQDMKVKDQEFYHWAGGIY